jgi:GntR family transcriptional regulator
VALTFRISTGSATSIYRQIVDQVRRAVAVGLQRPGDALPSVRTLAEQLVVNANTAAKAYGELVRDGLIEARPGRGYFVADRRQIYSRAERLRRLEQALEAFLSDTLVLNFTPAEIRAALDKKLAAIEPDAGTKRGQTDA